MKKITYILALLVVIISGCQVATTEDVTEDQIDLCEIDTDCVVVPFDNCCELWSKAINKEYLDSYNNHPEWQSLDCDALDLFCDPEWQQLAPTSAKCEASESGIKRCTLIS